MDPRFEQLFLTSPQMRRTLALADGSLLWVCRGANGWRLRHTDVAGADRDLGAGGPEAVDYGIAHDMSLHRAGEHLCLISRTGHDCIVYTTSLSMLVRSDVTCDWQQRLQLSGCVIGWLETEPSWRAVTLSGTGSSACITMGSIDSEYGWHPSMETAAPLALTPAAVRGPDGLHVCWCDQAQRLWYGRAVPDMSAWDHAPVIIHEAARQATLAATPQGILLAFESDDSNVGFAVIRDGLVIEMHERVTPGSQAETDPLRRDVMGCPRFHTDPAGDLWLWMISATRRAIVGCRWLSDSWGDMQPRGQLTVSAVRADHTRTDLRSIDVAEKSWHWPLRVVACAEAPTVLTRAVDVALGPRPLRPDSRLLFVDDSVISRWSGLTREPQAATPYAGNPVLDLGEPGRFDAERAFDSGTVLYDEGRFRMWYAARGALDTDPRWWRSTKLGYAESDNGLDWRKVDCGRHPAPDQNLLPGMTSYMIGVARDDGDPDPARRYKQLEVFNIIHERELIKEGVLSGGGGGYHGRLWTSPDGLVWSTHPIRIPPGPVQFRSVVPTCLLVDADDPPRRYKAYCYTSMTRSSRAVALLTSADGIHWRFDAANPVLDPEDRGYPWQPAGPVSHVHDVAVFRSGTDYLAIYQYIRHPIRLDLELAISPDGVGFRAAFADHAVIPRGGPGTWDRGIMTASPPVEAGRRQLLYYGATDYGHESDEPLDPQRERALSFRCGVAELRIDGFAALRLDGDAHDGWLETVPFTASEDLVLAVNADCRGGRVLVQIVDALTNAPLPNMSFTNCQPVVLDGLALQPQWSDSSGVIPAQRPIRLQLQLTAHTKTPRVYALCFQRPG